MLKKRIYFSIFCTLVFSLTIHAETTVWPKKKMAPIEHGSPSFKTKVLIAGKGSKFRNAIVSELAGRLVKDSIHVSIINSADLKFITPEKWNAILLVNKCTAGNYGGPVKKFFKSHPDFKRAVVFTTSADPVRCISEKKPERKAKVDTYTSASKDTKINESVDTLLLLLKKVLADNLASVK